MPQLYRYSNFNLPLVTQASVPSPARIGSTSTPGRAGSYAGKRYLDARQVKLSGVLIAPTYDELQSKWSQLCAAHNQMVAQPLFCGLEGRFLYALPESIDDTERGTEHIDFDITYLCHDPFFYSVSEQNISVSSPTNFSVSTNGNTNSLPRITVNIQTAPAGSTITLTNLTTNESFTLSPITTNPITIDSRLETATTGQIPFVLDQMGIFSGRFISLKGGVLVTDSTSSFQLTTTGGAVVTSLLINFGDRFI